MRPTGTSVSAASPRASEGRGERVRLPKDHPLLRVPPHQKGDRRGGPRGRRRLGRTGELVAAPRPVVGVDRAQVLAARREVVRGAIPEPRTSRRCAPTRTDRDVAVRLGRRDGHVGRHLAFGGACRGVNGGRELADARRPQTGRQPRSPTEHCSRRSHCHTRSRGARTRTVSRPRTQRHAAAASPPLARVPPESRTAPSRLAPRAPTRLATRRGLRRTRRDSVSRTRRRQRSPQSDLMTPSRRGPTAPGRDARAPGTEPSRGTSPEDSRRPLSSPQFN